MNIENIHESICSAKCSVSQYAIKKQQLRFRSSNDSFFCGETNFTNCTYITIAYEWDNSSGNQIKTI